MFFLLRLKVIGHSMEPTFHNGNILLASNIFYFFTQPKIGDIVVLKQKSSGKILVKRVTQIKNGKYFLEGDNKNDSLDSRKLGWFEKKDMVGKVLKKII